MGVEGQKSVLMRLRYEGAQKADDLERSLADTLDVKASILLVAVVFLVDLSSRLTEAQPYAAGHQLLETSAQVVSLLLLAASVVLIILEWWPRRYALPPDPLEEDLWISKLQAEAGNDGQLEESAVQEAIRQKLQKTLTRCQENRKINTTKSSLLKWAFWAIAPVVLTDLGALISLAVKKLCPLIG
jgi:hypothetical protein